jgi:FAD/FMN-containing dehydrogenase
VLIGDRRRPRSIRGLRAPPLGLAAGQPRPAAGRGRAQFAEYGVVAGELTNKAANPVLFHRLQDYSVRTSWKQELKARLTKDLRRHGSPDPRAHRGIHKEVLRGRVFVALHMHAGDGNVHTNIPVNSDNYEMLQTATRPSSASCTWRVAWMA